MNYQFSTRKVNSSERRNHTSKKKKLKRKRNKKIFWLKKSVEEEWLFREETWGRSINIHAIILNQQYSTTKITEEESHTKSNSVKWREEP